MIVRLQMCDRYGLGRRNNILYVVQARTGYGRTAWTRCKVVCSHNFLSFVAYICNVSPHLLLCANLTAPLYEYFRNLDNAQFCYGLKAFNCSYKKCCMRAQKQRNLQNFITKSLFNQDLIGFILL